MTTTHLLGCLDGSRRGTSKLGITVKKTGGECNLRRGECEIWRGATRRADQVYGLNLPISLYSQLKFPHVPAVSSTSGRTTLQMFSEDNHISSSWIASRRHIPSSRILIKVAVRRMKSESTVHALSADPSSTSALVLGFHEQTCILAIAHLVKQPRVQPFPLYQCYM